MVIKNYKVFVNWFLAPVLSVILFYSLYHQLIRQPDINLRWLHIKSQLAGWPFWLTFLLMPLNWGIEARKWQLLISSLQSFSWWKAFKSVLSGCSITMLTPNRIGEYGGRILYVSEGNRIKAISLTIAGSISQLLITLMLGSIGLLYLRFFSHGQSSHFNGFSHFWMETLLYLSIGVTLVLFIFFMKIGWLVKMMERIPALNRVTKHISVLDELNNFRLLRLLSLSMGRYLVFAAQYLILLNVMEVKIEPLLCFWLISVFYLVMAIAPTIGFTELPVRATASFTIFSMYSSNTLGIGAAALATWLINLVIPAIAGSLFMLQLKIMNTKTDETN